MLSFLWCICIPLFLPSSLLSAISSSCHLISFDIHLFYYLGSFSSGDTCAAACGYLLLALRDYIPVWVAALVAIHVALGTLFSSFYSKILILFSFFALSHTIGPNFTIYESFFRQSSPFQWILILPSPLHPPHSILYLYFLSFTRFNTYQLF